MLLAPRRVPKPRARVPRRGAVRDRPARPDPCHDRRGQARRRVVADRVAGDQRASQREPGHPTAGADGDARARVPAEPGRSSAGQRAQRPSSGSSRSRRRSTARRRRCALSSSRHGVGLQVSVTSVPTMDRETDRRGDRPPLGAAGPRHRLRRSRRQRPRGHPRRWTPGSPIVTIGRTADGFASVGIDHASAARIAVRVLLEAGHRDRLARQRTTGRLRLPGPRRRLAGRAARRGRRGPPRHRRRLDGARWLSGWIDCWPGCLR